MVGAGPLQLPLQHQHAQPTQYHLPEVGGHGGWHGRCQLRPCCCRPRLERQGHCPGHRRCRHDRCRRSSALAAASEAVGMRSFDALIRRGWQAAGGICHDAHHSWVLCLHSAEHTTWQWVVHLVGMLDKGWQQSGTGEGNCKGHLHPWFPALPHVACTRLLCQTGCTGLDSPE